MNVVQIDEASRTYTGPWVWSDESVPELPWMTLEAATADGYTLAPPPPPPVPVSVASWAFLVVIRAMGKEAALNAAIAAYSGPDADRVRAKWQRDPRIERDGATVDALGAAIGLTPPQVDQVFRDAEKQENLYP